MTMASHSPASPDRIGPYRLVKVLAEGGMGVVHRAVDEMSGDQVALKLVRVGSENLLASFRREIFALRSLEHPSVVRVVAESHLSVYDVLDCQTLLVSQAALEKLEERLAP